MKKIFGKYHIPRYIVGAYLKTFLCSALLFVAAFGVLETTGLYEKMERILDLKYNSPFVLVPLYGFAVLSVICFFIGFLMYLYKYKRSKTKSKFCRAFSKILEEKQTSKG